MRALLAKLMGYGVTGGIAAIVDAGGFALLLHTGLGVAAAGAVSFCAAAVVNYALSSCFVFAGRASAQGFALFFVVALIGLAVNLGVTLAGVYWLGLPPLAAKIAGIGVAFLVNFALNLRIVFRPSGAAAPQQGTPR
ncbi:MAG: GtrA family protein [Reyranella sp.]|uniref:GtrA family protein n=1 Tax=Reyranella sp. TaxID=1929291 RepID=UPI001ACC3324|nr:GtrA family protein [Reyranella sp.]MBN9089504.1 GtrA family protein [Reyranella sp.]